MYVIYATADQTSEHNAFLLCACSMVNAGIGNMVIWSLIKENQLNINKTEGECK